MYHNQGTSEESERPRRLEDNTAAYLLSIAAKIDETSKLPKSDESTEEQEILVNNVFEEIKSRTASAACDRRTNSVIEQLLLMAHLEVLIEAMSKFTPYAKFLSLNRHSSHVLEALFSRTSYIFKYVGIAPEMEREALNAILTMATAIFNSLDLLIKDVCGSHVIRSLLCLLTGIPAVGEKKGKNAKHQHNISLSVSMLDLMESNKFYINKAYCYQVPESFHEALTSDVVMYLQNKTHEELQALVCETNSCAVIILLLRILYNPHVIENGIEMANNLIVKCLNVPAVEEDMIDFMLTSLSGAGEEKKRKKDKKDKKKEEEQRKP